MKKKQYTKEFKEAAVKLVKKQNYTQAEVGRNLGVCLSNILRWCNELTQGNISLPISKPKDEEIMLLRNK